MFHLSHHSLAMLVLLAPLVGCNSLSSTSASVDTTTEVNLPPYSGPKARIMIDGFEWGVQGSGFEITQEYEDDNGERHCATWSAQTSNVTSGLEASLKNSLASTDRFIIADRKGMKKLKEELKLKDEGYLRQETAPTKGQVNGADLLIRGTVVEWVEDAGGGGGGLGGAITGGLLGGFGISSKEGRCVIQVEIVDLNTYDLLLSKQVTGEAKASSFGLGGVGWTGGAALGGVFSQYENKPMGKAIRQAIAEAIRLIAERVPERYYKYN